MKRNTIFLTAFFFFCAVVLWLTSTHVLDERSSARHFTPQRIERSAPISPKKPPYFAP
jgi:preprotein translocase subunit SecG